MIKVKQLQQTDLAEFWDIAVMAGGEGYYPQHKDSRIKWFKRIMNECSDVDYYGAYQDNNLRGAMALTSRRINIRNTMVGLAGIGMVHTDMLHKKEKVCKNLMQYAMNMNDNRDISLLFLSPFKPSFYKKMGFAYGTNLYRYKLKPSWFINKGNKSNLSYLSIKELDLYVNCHNKLLSNTHGEANKSLFFAPFTLGDGKRVVVKRSNNSITGALVFSFAKEKQLVIHEMFYEDIDTLYDFSSFLHSQTDQIEWIIYETANEYFYYILSQVTSSLNSLEIATCKVDNMFRIINVAGIFKELANTNFNNQNLIVELNIVDDFYQRNQGKYTINFVNGYPQVALNKTYDISIKIAISEFTSLFMGSVSATTLHSLGLLNVSDTSYLKQLDILFMTPHQPLCTIHI